MRFAIWTAVSTIAQADDDKESLHNQENKCRATSTGKGWIETAGPFIVPGESRTRWVNLRDAENEIPALRQMLETAKAGKFDVLVLYDYNRLRDLLDPVAKTLASYGAQIFSINQPVEPIPPEEFSPYSSDSESMMRGMSQIISRWQISDLRRKYKFGVPARVRKGLYALKIPYGYRKPPGREQDKNAIPIPDDSQSPAVMVIKELFLSGTSYRTIQAHLTKAGYPTATGAPWALTTIHKILRNPFYAGKVYFGRRRVIHDPRNDTLKVVDNPAPLIMDGKHKPLYSWEEYLQIQLELERRGRFNFSLVYPFSGLMKCSICGEKIKHKRDHWHCINYHVKLKDKLAMDIIPPVIKETLQNANLEMRRPVSKSDPLSQIAELEKQRKKIQQFAEREIYTPDEAETRIKEINAQIEGIKNYEATKQKESIAQQVFYGMISDLRDLPIVEWIRDDDPETVNQTLMRVVRYIEITPNFDVTVHLIIE